LFSAGEYIPLQAEGQRAAHVFAFARRHHGRTAIVLVPRLIAEMEESGFWGDTRLVVPSGLTAGRNLFTGHPADKLNVGHLLAEFPVAVLVS
jgi:(1->4)-alpha-D-glucan 1-alpha-D-glucosylmutase